MDEEEKVYEGKQVPVIINIPENTVKLEIKATMMDDDDNLFTAVSIMKTAEVIEARISGDQWEFENVKYCLSDLGKNLVTLDGQTE